MSKSVDETVIDFFALLLQEGDVDSSKISKQSTHASQEDLLAQHVEATSPRGQQNVATTETVASAIAELSPQRADNAKRAVIVKAKIADDKSSPFETSHQTLSPNADQSNADKDAEQTQSVVKSTPTRDARFDRPEFTDSINAKPQVTDNKPVRADFAKFDDADSKKRALEKLLAPVFKTAPNVAEPAIKPAVIGEAITDVKPSKALDESVQSAIPNSVPANNTIDEVVVEPQTQASAVPPSITKDLQEQLDDEFQVLFFKVAGLTLAVPLVSLGGIVKVDKINHIFGRPKWFMGVQTHREVQLNIVDTGAWVMPEKYDEALAQTTNYQYLVLLEDSNWGLACESLVNAVRIKKSQVNWRSKAGKRPWLAGVVKEQMCGILHVQALIEMLNLGLGCQDPIG